MFVMKKGTILFLFYFITSVGKKRKKNVWLKFSSGSKQKNYVLSNYRFKLSYPLWKNIPLYAKPDKIYLKLFSAC